MSRDNAVGIALLAGCGVSLGIMLAYIRGGVRPTYGGPTWLAVGAGLLFFGLLIAGFWMNRGSSGRFTGNDVGGPRRSLWDRIRGRGDHGGR